MTIDEKIKKAEEKVAALRAEKRKIEQEEMSKSSLNSETAQQEFLSYFNNKGLFKKKYGSNTFLLCKPEGFEKIGSGKDSSYIIYGRCIEIIDKRDGWDELDINRVETEINIKSEDLLFELQAKDVKTVKDIITGFLSFYEPSDISSFSESEASILNRIGDHLRRLGGKSIDF